MANVTIVSRWNITVGDLTISGEKDREGRSDKIHVEVRVPGSGFGMQETPEQKASTSVSTEEWAAIVRAVGNNTSTGA